MSNVTTTTTSDDPNNPNVETDELSTTLNENTARPSILVKLIRHAESQNNQVYRDARYIYRGGTTEFDEAGWTSYIEKHRQADPGLSESGYQQAQKLADYLVPHLINQAQHPISILVSPMRRTCLTIQPTLAGLLQHKTTHTSSSQDNNNNNNDDDICHVLAHGFYFESEGCHSNGIAEEGMNPSQIQSTLYPDNSNAASTTTTTTTTTNTTFVAFPDPNRGWWLNKDGHETRAESEQRAAKFYLWLCEYLDQQLLQPGGFDAGVSIPGEETEREHDKHTQRLRRRHTQLLIGHGDFMSLVLKRIVAGFGHAVESEGIPHRSAFVHWNTGITELEYFGKGRFLIMSQNSTPHLPPELLTGGSLKDGWSFMMPHDVHLLHAEVSVAFSDEEMEHYVVEQRNALKALYMNSKVIPSVSEDEVKNFLVDEEENEPDKKDHVKHFIVKHGHQVVATATYSEVSGKLSDVAVRPSAGEKVTKVLFDAVKQHAQKMGRSGSLLIHPRSEQSRQMFRSAGFEEVDETDSDHMELKH